MPCSYERRKEMKQLIVLISTVVLGIFIASLVLGLKTPSKTIADAVKDPITNIVTNMSAT